jgi:hypothetical protein
MRKTSGVSLFLMELIIMLCVFVTAAAIDTLMLVKASNMSVQSSDLDRAVECAVSAADSYKKTGGGKDIGMTGSSGSWSISYGRDWQPVSGGGTYVMTMDTGSDGAEINVSKQGKSIYSLSVREAQYEK